MAILLLKSPTYKCLRSVRNSTPMIQVQKQKKQCASRCAFRRDNITNGRSPLYIGTRKYQIIMLRRTRCHQLQIDPNMKLTCQIVYDKSRRRWCCRAEHEMKKRVAIKDFYTRPRVWRRSALFPPPGLPGPPPVKSPLFPNAGWP